MALVNICIYIYLCISVALLLVSFTAQLLPLAVLAVLGLQANVALVQLQLQRLFVRLPSRYSVREVCDYDDLNFSAFV
jgi:hypothetical protein